MTTINRIKDFIETINRTKKKDSKTITLQDLSYWSQMPYGQLHGYYSGKKEPSLPTLVRLAEVFRANGYNCTIRDLVNDL